MPEPEPELDALWDRMAEAIAAAGPRHEALFLAKLALLLGRELDDPVRMAELITTALRDLE